MSDKSFGKAMRVIAMCFFAAIFAVVVYGALGVAALIWDKVL